MAASVTKVYLGVIQDVVDKVRRELEEEGKSEDASALQELQEVSPPLPPPSPPPRPCLFPLCSRHWPAPLVCLRSLSRWDEDGGCLVRARRVVQMKVR